MPHGVAPRVGCVGIGRVVRPLQAAVGQPALQLALAQAKQRAHHAPTQHVHASDVGQRHATRELEQHCLDVVVEVVAGSYERQAVLVGEPLGLGITPCARGCLTVRRLPAPGLARGAILRVAAAVCVAPTYDVARHAQRSAVLLHERLIARGRTLPPLAVVEVHRAQLEGGGGRAAAAVAQSTQRVQHRNGVGAAAHTREHAASGGRFNCTSL
mmetsp:Transcript_7126/g.29113  ORF Transcript_7126/g.29113 Transcript_7126/m.29113 type:complete len:213 (+) Transcript_7126:344-982(+)